VTTIRLETNISRTDGDAV